MKHVLCYGDSNTYGSNPVDGSRFDEDHRWTQLLAKDLGHGYMVIEEGLGGRTTVFDDPETDYRNGKDFIVPCIRSHKPLDLVILMLGTNDIKPGLARCAKDIADGIDTLVKIILDPKTGEGYPSPAVLVVSPIEVSENVVNTWFNEMFGGLKAVDMSRALPPLVEAVAIRNGCYFIDAAKYASASELDAIHLGESGHVSLAHAFANRVRQIL